MNRLRARIGAMVLIVAGMLLTGGASSKAFAQPQIDFDFRGGEPNESLVGECLGNCGNGCGSFFGFTPCGGDRYWSITPTGVPVKVDEEWAQSCPTGYIWRFKYDVYEVSGTATFHGRYSDGCRSHDEDCRRHGGGYDCIDPLEQVLAGLCDGAHDETWSYETVFVGLTHYPTATERHYGERCFPDPPEN